MEALRTAVFGYTEPGQETVQVEEVSLEPENFGETLRITHVLRAVFYGLEVEQPSFELALDEVTQAVDA